VIVTSFGFTDAVELLFFGLTLHDENTVATVKIDRTSAMIFFIVIPPKFLI
jgi:hypothetical protein